MRVERLREKPWTWRPGAWALGLVMVLAGVAFVGGSPDRVGELAYVAGRSTAAVVFTLALVGLVLERAISGVPRRADPATDGADPARPGGETRPARPDLSGPPGPRSTPSARDAGPR